jgi:hypothetical protein
MFVLVSPCRYLSAAAALSKCVFTRSKSASLSQNHLHTHTPVDSRLPGW